MCGAMEYRASENVTQEWWTKYAYSMTFTLFFAALQDGCQDMADYMFKF